MLDIFSVFLLLFFLRSFGPFLASNSDSSQKNNVGLCPPDLKTPTGGDFSGIEVNFDEGCSFHNFSKKESQFHLSNIYIYLFNVKA